MILDHICSNNQQYIVLDKMYLIFLFNAKNH